MRNPRNVVHYCNFIKPFIALAMAKLDFAMTCLDSFVASRMFCTSLRLFACSLSSCSICSPLPEEPEGKLSLQTATILETIVMICVKSSFRDGDWVALRTPDNTFCIA